jgi:hypothetical protein
VARTGSTLSRSHNVLTQSSDPELAVANIERPKVIYNSTTGNYVMCMHKENGSDYTQARAFVAVSDTVDGDYTYQSSFRPPTGTTSRDMTLFKDDDGTVYQITSANNNADLQIRQQRLEAQPAEVRDRHEHHGALDRHDRRR